MSRHSVTLEDGSVVAYGLDHVFGYFYQKFEPGYFSLDEDAEESQPVERHGRGDVLEALVSHGLAIPDIHKAAIAMDMPL